MSHTRRRAPIDVAKKEPNQVMPFGMGVWSAKPTAKEVREAHQDGKPHHKPSKRVKGYLSKGAKAKARRQLDAVVQDPDSAVLPVTKRDHIWLYN